MSSQFEWIGKSKDGQTITLHRFNGEFRPSNRETKNARKAIALDVETTGLSPHRDAVIEIGIREFEFDRETGELVSVGEGLSQLQDPGVPLSDTVKRVTGLSDEDLSGQKIDWDEVDARLSTADLILAHNAAFDRPFVEKYSQASEGKVWGCSLTQVDWLKKGFTASKLEMLCVYHGFFADAHRALEDADVLIHLLSFEDQQTGSAYLKELIDNARIPRVHVFADQAPFEAKDELKLRGYRWDSRKRVWNRILPKSEAENEVEWLESTIYQGRFSGRLEPFQLRDQFKQVP